MENGKILFCEMDNEKIGFKLGFNTRIIQNEMNKVIHILYSQLYWWCQLNHVNCIASVWELAQTRHQSQACRQNERAVCWLADKAVERQQTLFSIHDVTTKKMETDMRARLIPARHFNMASKQN